MRIFMIVLDSLGIGELPDAKKFGDAGSNTLKSIYASKSFKADNLKSMGLFNIDGTPTDGVSAPTAAYCRLGEASNGKDTITGHREMCQIISEVPDPTYPNGFPDEIIKEFEKRTGKGTLCNLPYSGTEVIKDYGEESIKTGKLIVYTSADSVFQIAAHEDYVPISDLYKYCEIAREMLQGEHCVGRVIARPFAGTHPFYRTKNRHDYSSEVPRNLLNILNEAGKDVISVGKINDIFSGSGITKVLPGKNNEDACISLDEAVEMDFDGLCFANLVDFDAVFGHRNNIDGYAEAVSTFDKWLGTFLEKMRDTDVLILTSDHGCDPATPSTDHSREYIFALIYGKQIEAKNCGTRNSFADIGKTVATLLNVEDPLPGESIL